MDTFLGGVTVHPDENRLDQMVRPIPVLANMKPSVEMVAGACIETSAETEFFVLEIPRKHRAG